MPRLGTSLAQEIGEFVRALDNAHPATTAAVRRLDDRLPVRPHEIDRLLQRLVRVLGQLETRHHGDSTSLGLLAGRDFVSDRADDIAARTDEREAGVTDTVGEGCVLAEEAVAGMDGIDTGSVCNRQHLVMREVGLNRALALADQVGLVRLVAVLVGRILLAEDGNGPDPEFGAGTKDADRDLATIGAEQLLEGSHLHGQVRGVAAG
jgi:hypothetical protein